MRKLKIGEYRTNFTVQCFDIDGEAFVEASTAFILPAVEIAKTIPCWRAEVICEGTGMILYTFENGRMTYSFTEWVFYFSARALATRAEFYIIPYSASFVKHFLIKK